MQTTILLRHATYPYLNYKNANGKRLWSGKDNEVSQGDRDVWGNINTKVIWRDHHDPKSVL